MFRSELPRISMSLESEFSGVYFAGREKFAVRFEVSRRATLECRFGDHGLLDVPLQKTDVELIGDPLITLQLAWSDGAGRHALLCNDPKLFDVLLTQRLPPDRLALFADLQRRQRQQVDREHRRVPLYMALTAAFLAAGYALFHFSAPLVAQAVPFEWEQKIGALASESYQTGKKTVTDPVVNDAVDKIVKRMEQFDGAEISYRVAVVDASMINAFAFPGGYVVVTTGLIENADNPEQVAGVLAHELTHVLEHHSMRKLVRQAGLGMLIGIVFGDVSALSQLVELASQLDSLSFDRDQERSADDGAIKIMTAAGLSPRQLAGFFEKFQKADTVSGDIPELFQTHPLTEDRIKRFAEAGEPEKVFRFEVDWNRVQQRLK